MMYIPVEAICNNVKVLDLEKNMLMSNEKISQYLHENREQLVKNDGLIFRTKIDLSIYNEPGADKIVSQNMDKFRKIIVDEFGFSNKNACGTIKIAQKKGIAFIKLEYQKDLSGTIRYVATDKMNLNDELTYIFTYKKLKELKGTMLKGSAIGIRFKARKNIDKNNPELSKKENEIVHKCLKNLGMKDAQITMVENLNDNGLMLYVKFM